MDARILIVSPVRNEADHIDRVVAAMEAQTRPPDLWLVADDSSDDGTPELLRALEARVPFMRVVQVPRADGRIPDRLALALEARAFNAALGQVDWSAFTHVGKLDGDIELPPDYFARLLEDFAASPGLGISGGSIVEPDARSGWKSMTAPAHHVHGALKLYARDCFAAIGGIQEQLGWDTIDETYARMRGFSTHRRADIVARHHRPGGSADGKLRGRMRHGQCAYITRYPLAWVLLRSLKIAKDWDPRPLSGAAFAWGYVRCMLRRAPRVEDPAFRDFVRAELRGRAVDALRPGRRTLTEAQRA